VTFQAPGFYERQGYEVLGRIECDPPGHTRSCMTKRLDAAPTAPVAGRVPDLVVNFLLTNFIQISG
jgi:hypothetical protein